MHPPLVYPTGLGLRVPRVGQRRMVGALLTGVALWGLVRVGDEGRTWFDELLPPAAGLGVGLWLLVSS